jgi:hypothetical protein
MTPRMTAPRLARLVAERDADAVRAAVAGNPALLTRTVEREGQGGWTPLHVAVAEGDEGDPAAVVRVLLAAGADVDATTSDGASALDISRVAAARHRRDDAGRATRDDALVELLAAHGATS